MAPRYSHATDPETSLLTECRATGACATESAVRQFTTRAVTVGLFVGTIVNLSNTYFGLQTGWVSMMSMPSSLIGFAIFKSLAHRLEVPFTPVENVLVQTVAVAVGSMPLSAGFVGVIPALEKLLKASEGGPIVLSIPMLIFWSFGVAFFGVFFAVPLRRQVIIREKLKFPSGTATALMISVLHGDPEGIRTELEEEEGEEEGLVSNYTAPQNTKFSQNAWKQKTKILLRSFAVSGIYTLISYFFTRVRHIPIFGITAANQWLWSFNPSPAYIGQGIIMGPETTGHMLFGTIIGWVVLGPFAKMRGWAPGPAGDWRTGSRGWIVWVSLAIMLSDSIVSLGGIILEPLIRRIRTTKEHKTPTQNRPQGRGSYQQISTEDGGVDIGQASSGLRRRRQSKAVKDDNDDPTEQDAPPGDLVPNSVVIVGLIMSGALCITAVRVVFGQVPLYATIVAFLLALVLSVMGVRALGQTDLNPVSGISKLTQLIFAVVVPASNPAAVAINLVVGAVSEAGAQQAGDIMQDLKTGHLIGAAPRAQFFGQLIGSVFGAVLSACVYRLYSTVYPIPGDLFQVPTAYVWIDCARLVYGHGLPQGVWAFAVIFAGIFAITTVLRAWVFRGTPVAPFIPGGIAVAVGMYNVPSFTLARAIGGCVQWYWTKYCGNDDDGSDDAQAALVVLASGLILGEGMISILNLAMASFGVPHY